MASTLKILVLLLLFLARALSQLVVDTLPGFPGKLPFKLQTGSGRISRSSTVLLQYFIESEKSPESDQLFLWLTGGPGCSALSGLLYEIGPFTINYANSSGDIPALELNQWPTLYFWINLLGQDSLMQKHGKLPCLNDTLSAQLAYNFLIEWLLDHPKFLSNPLYIAGDFLCWNHYSTGLESGVEPRLNMKGYVEGNPVTDKYADPNNRVVYAYRMGLLSDNLYKSTKVSCNGNYSYNIDEHPEDPSCQYDLQRVSKCIKKIRLPQILEPWCPLSVAENPVSLLLPQHWCRGRYTIKYSEKEYELPYATVKGVGHTAPEYKPQQCLSMFQRWLSNYPL